jgi:hypothetical protein
MTTINFPEAPALGDVDAMSNAEVFNMQQECFRVLNDIAAEFDPDDDDPSLLYTRAGWTSRLTFFQEECARRKNNSLFKDDHIAGRIKADADLIRAKAAMLTAQTEAAAQAQRQAQQAQPAESTALKALRARVEDMYAMLVKISKRRPEAAE